MIYTQNKNIKMAYVKYMHSTDYDLWDVYETFSSDKINAFKACESFCQYYNGWDLKIVSSNNFHFTAGFMCDIDGRRAFIYMTYSNNYCLYL